jgi:hypothetical protein
MDGYATYFSWTVGKSNTLALRCFWTIFSLCWRRNRPGLNELSLLCKEVGVAAIQRKSWGMVETEGTEQRKEAMWQIICLCLPAVTHSEQQRFFTLFKEVLHAYGREPGEMDISLLVWGHSDLERSLFPEHDVFPKTLLFRKEKFL